MYKERVYLNDYIYFLNSALDAESEKIVQEALDYAVKGISNFYK